MKELINMENSQKNGFKIYNSLKHGEITFEKLSEQEITALFDYLCEKTEEGICPRQELLTKCAEALRPAPNNATEIMQSTYRRIGFTEKQGKKPIKLFRRLLVAAAAVFIFAGSVFVTAAALNLDMPGAIKSIINTNKHEITFEDYGDLNDKNNPKLTGFNSLAMLFNCSLPEFIFPEELPKGVYPYKVTEMPEGSSRLFVVNFKSNSKDWTMCASKAENSYMPMGYDYNNGTLDFVYTISRRGSEIYKIDTYTVYNGIQYSFRMYTDSKEEAFKVLDSIKIP